MVGVRSRSIKVELFMIHWMLNLVKNNRAEISHKAMVTSYEIVCAILRSAPSRAYLEFEDHPLPIVV